MGNSQGYSSFNQDEPQSDIYNHQFINILSNFIQKEANAKNNEFLEHDILQLKNGTLLQLNPTYQLVLKCLFQKTVEEYQQHCNYWETRTTKIIHPNVIQLHACFKQDNVTGCSQGNYKVGILVDQINGNLQDEVQNKQNYQEEELWILIDSIVGGLSFLQQQGYRHSYLKLQTIYIVQNIYSQKLYKVADEQLMNYPSLYSEVRNEEKTQGAFLSPELLQGLLNNKFQVSHNSFKSDVFTFGMILLQISLWSPSAECYDWSQRLIKEPIFYQKINMVREKYSPEFFNFMQEILNMNEQHRPDWIQLDQKLNQYPQLMGKRIIQQQPQPPNLFQCLPQPIQPGQGGNQQQQQQQQYMQQQQQPIEQAKQIFQGQTQQDQQQQMMNSQQFSQQGKMQSNSQIFQQGQDGKTMDGQQQNLNQGQTQSFVQQNQFQTPQQGSFQNQQGSSFQSQQNQFQTGGFQQQQQQQQQQSNLFSAQNNQFQSNQQMYNNPQQNQQNQFNQFSNNQYGNNSYNKSFLNQTAHFQDQYNQQNQMQNQYGQFNNNQFDQNQNMSNMNNFQTPQQFNRFGYNQQQFGTNQTGFMPSTIGMTPQQQMLSQMIPQLSAQGAVPIVVMNSAAPTTQLPHQKAYSPIKSITGQDKARIKYNDQSKYEGEVCNGLRDGWGTLVFPDGAYIEGQWCQDKVEGKARLFNKDKTIAYEGDWSDDMLHGLGHLYNKDKKKLNGSFDYSDFSKLGNYWSKYEGQFVQDKKEGFGVLTLTNGEKFSGCFVADNVHGYGTFHRHDKKLIKANWISNKIDEESEQL